MNREIFLLLPVILSLMLLQSKTVSHTGTIEVSQEPIIKDFPGVANDLIKNACMECHAQGGKALAMAKLNFGKWEEYSAEDKAKKARKMCDELVNESMPPKSYRKNHPQFTPTQEQIDAICKWSNTLQ